MTFGIPVSELPITSTGAIKIKNLFQWIKTRKAIDLSRMKTLEECYNKNTREQQEQKQQLQEQQQQRYFSMSSSSNSSSCSGFSSSCSSNTSQHRPQSIFSSSSSSLSLASDFCAYPTYQEFLTHHGEEPIIHPMINDVLFSKGGKNITHYGNIEFTDLMKRSLMEYVAGKPVQNRKMRKSIRQAIVDEVQARGGRFLKLDKKLLGGCCWTEIEEGPDLHDRIATSLYDHKRRLAAKLKLKTNRCGSGTVVFSGIDNSKRRKVVTDDGQPIPVGLFCTHGANGGL